VSEIRDPVLSRRRFLQLALAGAATATVGSGGCDFGSLPEYPFRLGIASGDPLPDRVVLWTRLAMDPLAPGGTGGMPPRPLAVLWEVAHDAAFQVVVRSGYAVADPSLAHSVHVDVGGLEPDRWYFYRFRAGGHVSDVGRTRTFPAPDASPSQMRFVSASCQNWQSGYYPAHAAIAAEDIDFVAFLGDYIYEGGASGSALRAHDGPRLRDLAGYRNRYALYKSDPDLQAAHRSCPWIVTWDDHEVSNNYAGLLQDENGGSDYPDPALFPEVRAAAYLAWYEHQPVRLLPPKGSALRIYRSLGFGDLAALFVLDTRQYRTDQDCGDDLFNACSTFPNPAGDMLGPQQEAWLLGGLAASQARWNVLAQQVVFSPTPLGIFRNYDQWDGYPHARQRIVDFLRARPQRDSVVLTGDIHSSGVGWVPGLTPGDPSTYSDPVAAEFVATGISSSGLPASQAALVQQLFSSYPHVAYFETVTRGYLRHEVTRDAWRADVRFVESVLQPVSPVFTETSFVAEHGVLTPLPA
jgi:alkaline phosphatase D